VSPRGRRRLRGLLGKGIGYARKPGDLIAEGISDQVFLPVGDPDARALVDLLGAIPASYVLLAREIITRAQDTLQVTLHPHLLLALTDHLHFAVEREQQGLAVTNGLAWEIRTYYPDEYAIGAESLSLINARLGVGLPEDEAANIAFHLVNARNDTNSTFNALRAAQLISEIVTIVSYALGERFDHDELNHRRFITHLQFFANRLFAGRLLDEDGGFLYHHILQRYPEAIACAQRVRSHVENEYGVTLPEEEIGYLGLHIQRLRGRNTDPFEASHD